MKPREKAVAIVIKMQFQKEPLMFEQAKQCALIAINLLFEDAESLNVRYWNSVKNEIEKL